MWRQVCNITKRSKFPWNFAASSCPFQFYQPQAQSNFLSFQNIENCHQRSKPWLLYSMKLCPSLTQGALGIIVTIVCSLPEGISHDWNHFCLINSRNSMNICHIYIYIYNIHIYVIYTYIYVILYIYNKSETSSPYLKTGWSWTVSRKSLQFCPVKITLPIF